MMCGNLDGIRALESRKGEMVVKGREFYNAQGVNQIRTLIKFQMMQMSHIHVKAPLLKCHKSCA